jgi:hypothetical protein
MRKENVRRFVSAAAASVALATAGMAIGGTPASAADTVVLNDCRAIVQATPGQAISLNPAAVIRQLNALLAPLDPLNVLRPPFTQIWNGLGPIALGTAGQAEGTISGAVIGDAVVGKLREISLLAPVIDVLAPAVKSLLSTDCGVTTQPGEPAPPGSPAPAPPGGPDGPGTPSPQPQRPPNSPGAEGSGSSSYVPPEPAPGIAMLPAYPPGIPGPGIPPDGVAYSYGSGGVPQAGIPAVDATTLGSRSTGTAQALPARTTGIIGQPMLLATLLVTLVGTQLVRTWILRRARRITE